jgi:hypothetical protein
MSVGRGALLRGNRTNEIKCSQYSQLKNWNISLVRSNQLIRSPNTSRKVEHRNLRWASYLFRINVAGNVQRPWKLVLAEHRKDQYYFFRWEERRSKGRKSEELAWVRVTVNIFSILCKLIIIEEGQHCSLNEGIAETNATTMRKGFWVRFLVKVFLCTEN